MTRWVIDASVSAKWVLPEAESPLADTLLGHTLLAPDLIQSVPANILWKKQQRAEMSPAAAVPAVQWRAHCPISIWCDALRDGATSRLGGVVKRDGWGSGLGGRRQRSAPHRAAIDHHENTSSP
jgi:hypothetical protein